MATFAELDAIARSLPEVTVRFSTDDRPEYRVRDKTFCALRGLRKDAIDPVTGLPMDDVVMIRTSGLAGKEELLADESLPLFTTPHFDGWPAVLVRVRHLASIDSERLRVLITTGWRVQAPKRLWRESPGA
ncbi:MAG TPA: hypothetical protein VFN03_02710 [Trueperaceae bacterium]|nr:hypothetical protein [Trueperaceae bacterium]